MTLQLNKSSIMKKTSFMNRMLWAGLCIASITALSSCDDSADAPAPPSVANTLAKVLTDSGYTKLVSAVGTAGLTSVFTSDVKYTVFAPSDAAFNAAGVLIPTNQTALANLLKYHVLAGNLKAADVIAASNGNLIGLPSANGDSLWIKASAAKGVFVNGVKVTRPDIMAVNGVSHGIERVLFPPTGNIIEVAIAAKFDSLAKAVVRAATAPGGDPTLLITLSTATLTVFAPTNAAFTNLLTTLGKTDINDIDVPTLVAVLKHHATAGRVFSSDLSNNLSVSMVNGSSSTILISGATASIQGAGTVLPSPAATIVLTDVMAKNGVIHAIDKVIIP
jgi:uncharacterized surface protein with fasciclin (FAS1) repeats